MMLNLETDVHVSCTDVDKVDKKLWMYLGNLRISKGQQIWLRKSITRELRDVNKNAQMTAKRSSNINCD